MKSSLRVGTPPERPTVIYDGDCKFCRLWIRRWQHMTGESVDYLPFQNPRAAAQFAELPREQCERAVQLVERDGTIYSGAEAAFRALSLGPSKHHWGDWYERWPWFARSSEWVYRLVAEHRRFFSFLTRVGWGDHVEPPSYSRVRWAFLTSLGLIYLAAFISLWTQITALIGSEGILPAHLTMQFIERQVDEQKIGLDRYRLVPTLCWLGTSDAFLKAQCALGCLLAILLINSVAPAPCLFLLWLIYLSLTTVCREFLSFQWDNLLLEAGFLAIFLAPLQMLPRRAKAAPSRLVVWLLRWLLFRLMFESGCVKWLSNDPTWRNLTALNFHYETQPLATWIGWYAHQLPAWMHKTSTLLMFAIELLVPFLIFGPRRFRQVAALTLAGLQAIIFLTGNYCFFNLLTMALCLLLLDDAALEKFIPRRWRSGQPEPSLIASRKLRAWPRPITIALSAMVLTVSIIQFFGVFRVRMPWPKPVVAVYQWLSPFRSLNTYGLFAVMTTVRREIIIEGSNDQQTWLPYEFKYKPGRVNGRPGFVAPHQPRLDWQMWFAALGTYQQNPWFFNFCFRLLQGEPSISRLLKHNPFANAPPRYVRAVVYEYHFTTFAERRQNGYWWRRELKGLYLPPITLGENRDAPPSRQNKPSKAVAPRSNNPR